MTILVTGGAGYVGSHTVRAMLEAAIRWSWPTTSAPGFRAAVPGGLPIFHEGDIRDAALLARSFRTENIDGVIHFAAFSQVGESGNCRCATMITTSAARAYCSSR